MKVEKAERLRQEGILELSPLSAGLDSRSENAACTSGLPYTELITKQNARWRTRANYLPGVQGNDKNKNFKQKNYILYPSLSYLKRK
jgi:hypothetical protein